MKTGFNIPAQEPEPKRLVRPYTVAESRAVAFDAGEPTEDRVARLAVTKLIDEARFSDAADHLKISGHLDRVLGAKDTFLRYFVDEAKLDYSEVMAEARATHEAVQRENAVNQAEAELQLIA